MLPLNMKIGPNSGNHVYPTASEVSKTCPAAGILPRPSPLFRRPGGSVMLASR